MTNVNGNMPEKHIHQLIVFDPAELSGVVRCAMELQLDVRITTVWLDEPGTAGRETASFNVELYATPL